ncbi:MAG: thermonuclease family protein [Corynebacterium sp.]|uniref:thermonuclease family protein n=1 Tax=Corynebacterium sp. TaxID=1720 RepID=UPI0026DA77C1|nr:thermonuclease family protein [Corynebacterium sp.]MDO5029792.1 thermonuclease family protein [Corynebacterium sp.]
MGFLKVISAIGATGIVAAVAVNAVAEESPVPVATVERVIDGDTIDVQIDGELTRVRLLNVDTPEIGRNGRPSECLALEAKSYLESLLPEGSTVELQFDVEKHDKYGRTLAGVYKDEQLVNAQIAQEGFGTPMQVGANSKFYSAVRQASDSAGHQGIGVHSLDTECTITNSDTLDPVEQAREALEIARNQSLSDLSDDLLLTAVAQVYRTIDHSIDSLDRLREDITSPSIKLTRPQKQLFSNEIDALTNELKAERSNIATTVRKKQARRDDAYSSDSLAIDDEMSTHNDASGVEVSAPDVPQTVSSDQNTQNDQWNNSPNPPAAEAPEYTSTPAYTPAPAYTPTPQPQTQPEPAPAPAAPVDTYTGCRAYGGNYAFNSIDNQGRPYAKIDCTTKQQIG